MNMLCFWEMVALLPKHEPEQQLPEPGPGCPGKPDLRSEPVALLPPEAMAAVMGSQKAALKHILLRTPEIKERLLK